MAVRPLIRANLWSYAFEHQRYRKVEDSSLKKMSRRKQMVNNDTASPPSTALPERNLLKKYQYLIPVFNEEDCIPSLFTEFLQLWKTTALDLIFVDDGSTDSTATLITHHLEAAGINGKVISLATNTGKDIALQAGYTLISSDHEVIVLDGDGQHGSDTVQSLIKAYESDQCDIVFGIRDSRSYQRKGERLAAVLAYKFINLGSFAKTIRNDVGDIYVCSAPVAAFFKKYDSVRPFWKGLYSVMGFRAKYHRIKVKHRAKGRSKFTLSKRAMLAIGGVADLNFLPLRVVFFTGLTTIFLSLLMLLHTLYKYFTGVMPADGYYTLVCLILLFGGGNLAAIGIVSEYLISSVRKNSGIPVFAIREVTEHRI